MSALPLSLVETEPEAGFDYNALVDEMRCCSNESLRSTVRTARRERERWRLQELAATLVLDERDALDKMPDPSVSARTARSTLEVARQLKSMPEIATAVHDGALSWDQLQPLVEVATPDTDAEWATRGPRLSPADLQRMVQRTQRVTAAEAEARHQARHLRAWRDDRQGMHGGRWWLPDIDGTLVDKVLDHMAERMRPETGQAWDSLTHRKADALVELCRSYAEVEPTGRFRIEVVNIVDPNAKSFGPEINGMPIAAETLTALWPQAKVRDCVVDETGVARTVNKPRPALPRDLERHIRRRDQRCRTPGCTDTRRLDIHHLNPRYQHGDTLDPSELAAVCPHHHHMLEPHGPYRFVGNAEYPDGLKLVHRDDLARDGPAP